MKIYLTAHGVELSNELRDYTKRRVYFSLGRLTGQIKSLSVRLSDINGPRGGVDKCCQIRVETGLHRTVVIREQQESIYTAVALAVERAERAVLRQLSWERPDKTVFSTRRPDYNFGG